VRVFAVVVWSRPARRILVSRYGNGWCQLLSLDAITNGFGLFCSTCSVRTRPHLSRLVVVCFADPQHGALRVKTFTTQIVKLDTTGARTLRRVCIEGARSLATGELSTAHGR
jgi:hypothetical protein